MAKSGNSAGTSAGQVYVSLRADLSQLEADLNKAKGMVQGTAKPGGMAGGAAETVASAKAIASAQDTIVSATTRSGTAVGNVGFKAREAAREVREQVALLKDQLGDTTAFSGAGFADLLFGIDASRIAITRLGSSLADLKKQKVNLDADLLKDPGNKELVKNLGEVNRGITETEKALDGYKKNLSGFGGFARGIGATLASSLASSLLIGAGIGAAVAGIQLLVDAGSKLVDQLVNPAKFAAAAFTELAAAVNKVGGADAFAGLLGLEGPLKALAAAAAETSALTANTANLNALFGAAGAQGRFGLSAEAAVTRGSREQAIAAATQNFGGLGPLSVGFGEKEGRAAAAALGADAVKEFDRALAKGRQAGGPFSGILDANIVKLALERAAGVAYDRVSAAVPKADPRLVAERSELERQRALSAGTLPAAQMTTLEKMKADISGDRAKLEAMSRGGQMAQIARTLADAQTAVGRAGIAGAGDTIFDVAQRRAEAVENLKRSREDAARQRASIAIQQRIADKTAALEAKTKDEELLKAIEALTAKIGDGVTVEVVEPSDKDAKSIGAALSKIIIPRWGGDGKPVKI